MVLHSYPDIKYTKLYINDEFVEGVEGKTFSSINPSTEEKICEISEGTKADIDKAVAAAKAAFKLGSTWRTMDASARGRYLLKWADLIEENQEELAKLVMLETGKSYKDAIAEAKRCVVTIKYFAGWSDKTHGRTIPADGPVFSMTRKEPVGVCGIITPWNVPLFLLVGKISPAIATGCTVVAKPSEFTSLVALYVADLVKQAEFPPGVINIVTGYGNTAGAALSEHQDVNKISFTGSTRVGRLITEAAAKTNLKRVSLELGGKSPLVICDDADLEKAVEIAHQALFFNAGQICCSPTRIFVQDTIYDDFVKLSSEKAKKRTVGNPFEKEVEQGPQINKVQFQKVLDYIESGVSEGAKLKCGGKRHGNKGYFIEPTVFADVTDNMKIAREEIFGPVQQLLKFSTLEEAIERSNDTSYGLASGIITTNLNKALMYSQGVEAGSVWVNCFNATRMQSPFGGFKQSGQGREYGEEGVEGFLETKTITIQIPQKNS